MLRGEERVFHKGKELIDPTGPATYEGLAEALTVLSDIDRLRILKAISENADAVEEKLCINVLEMTPERAKMALKTLETHKIIVNEGPGYVLHPQMSIEASRVIHLFFPNASRHTL